MEGAGSTEDAGGGVRCRSLRKKLFGGEFPQDLKKAIILKEVLGPPLALRE
jgi:hypothetical protein